MIAHILVLLGTITLSSQQGVSINQSPSLPGGDSGLTALFSQGATAMASSQHPTCDPPSFATIYVHQKDTAGNEGVWCVNQGDSSPWFQIGWGSLQNIVAVAT